MQQIFAEDWAFMYYGVILAVTLSQMLVVYFLTDSSNPPAGLGMFTVYFMAALLGWMVYALQQGVESTLAIDVPSVAAILNGYILFVAMGQRAGKSSGRLILGAVCVVACLSVFFLPQAPMFLVQAATSAAFFTAAGLLAADRCWRQRNAGDAVIAVAALALVIGMSVAVLNLGQQADFERAQTVTFTLHSASFALVAVGFLGSVVIEYQQHLSQLATEDPLTRLLNRRGLQDALHVSLASASRQGLPTAAIMVDIDHFKQVNDSFGHEVGDQVLCHIAATLEQMSRASDVVARTGGEEFLLVLPDTNLDSARTLAERIRSAIGERPLLVAQQRIPVTISLGVSSVQGEVDLDALSQEAAKAVYIAKRGGRNRVSTIEHRPVHMSATS